MPTRITDRPSSSHRWIMLIGVGALGLAGYFGPWIPHRAAGLVIAGLDLAEYVKFLPEVMSGEILLRREVFCVPLISGSFIATLLASRPTLAPLLRRLLLLAATVLALAQLPPAWSPSSLQAPEFRIQVTAILLCLAAVPLVGLIKYLPDGLVLAGLSLLALTAALWAAWSFLQVRPAIAVAYHAPSPIGWGLWIFLVGYGGLTFLGLAFSLAQQSRSSK